MAIDLKKTDVVIVGLGAVGGVAALPLARAGLNVIGIEAGSWLTPRDFAPDELRNNFRGWPQSVQKTNSEIPTHRPNASAPYSPRLPIHPMMNAVGGTSLHYWAQSWRLNPWDFKVVSETTRRYGASRIPKGSRSRIGLLASMSLSRITMWSNGKSVYRAKPETLKGPSIRGGIFSKADASGPTRCPH
jgi:gluconate 2-dehydrogenase alpha chain